MSFLPNIFIKTKSHGNQKLTAIKLSYISVQESLINLLCLLLFQLQKSTINQ